MKKYNIGFLLILIVFSFMENSCFDGKQRSNNSENKVALEPSGEILKIAIDKNTTLDCLAMFYYKSKKTGKEYLTYLNSYKNEIQFYDLEMRKLVSKVTCALEGPDGVGKISGGFGVVNFDSIYVMGLYSVFLLDSTGKIINKFDLERNREKIPTTPRVTSRVYRPFVIKDENLYFTQNLIQEGLFMPKGIRDPHPNSKVCLIVDKHGQSKYLPMEHPFADEKGIFSSLFSREFDGKNFVYSFFDSPDIYVTKDHINIEKFNASSKYVDKIQHLKYKTMPSIEEHCIDHIKRASYHNIIYDNFRKVYYRFVQLPYDYKKGEDFMKVVEYPQNFSIIILSSDFQVIGETKFPSGTYQFTDFFVAEKGLYLSINHINNSKLDINHLQFELIKLKYNEN